MMKGSDTTCNQLYISSHLWVKCLVATILVLWIQILFAFTELNMAQGGKKNSIFTYTTTIKKKEINENAKTIRLF